MLTEVLLVLHRQNGLGRGPNWYLDDSRGRLKVPPTGSLLTIDVRGKYWYPTDSKGNLEVLASTLQTVEVRKMYQVLSYCQYRYVRAPY